MATAQQRRAAQRKIARQVRTGTYQPSPAGAKARTAARQLKQKHPRQQYFREFTSLDDAVAYTQFIHATTKLVIMGYGTFASEDYDKPEDWAWLSSWQFPNRFKDPAVVQSLRDREQQLFTGGAQKYRVYTYRSRA